MFWAANWFAPHQWATLTGEVLPTEPRIQIFAVAPEGVTQPWAGYSLAHTTAFLTGDTPYGPLRALALGAVSYSLADEQAVHYVPSLCVKQNEQGMLLLIPQDADWLASLSRLMGDDKTHLVAFDGVFVRYGLVRMVDGVTMLPTQIRDEQGITTRGYRLFPWLDEYGFDEPRADARCLTLEGGEEYCFARDLDLARAPDVMAYPLEQAWYLPTQVVAAEPALVGALWRDSESESASLLENVPALDKDLWARFGQWAREKVSTMGPDSVVGGLDEREIAEVLCRLRGSPQARAIVPPEQLWPGRAGGHPWQPIWIKRVALLYRTGSEDPAPSALSDYLAGVGAQLSGLHEEEASRVLTRQLGRAVGQTG
jgi:hypothetical protein